ncbi:MAG: hypothetical protein ACREP9_05180, partial [Candidatus Dormibacteraceae bacterium]
QGKQPKSAVLNLASTTHEVLFEHRAKLTNNPDQQSAVKLHAGGSLPEAEIPNWQRTSGSKSQPGRLAPPADC